MTDLARLAATIASRYHDDFNGYRRDILGMRPLAWQDAIGLDLVRHRRVAVSSGHGVGKTALGAAAIHWFLATRANPAIIATANTESQLKTKLWRELQKLNRGAKNGQMFTWYPDRFSLAGDMLCSAHAVTWSENNPEAFAGTHEKNVLLVFDESSNIPQVIWTTAAGAMSTSGARWLALGNPTRSHGVFYEACHGKLRWRREGDDRRGMWRSHIVSSMDSEMVDPGWVEEMRVTLGEDSDDWRVRVLGLPPRFSDDQFIPLKFVEDAMSRRVKMFERWPLVLGVDVGGSDRSTIVPRRGRVVLDRIKVLRGERTTDFARVIAKEIEQYRNEMGLDPEVVIEQVGVGVGVVETLQDLGYGRVHGFYPQVSSSEPLLYGNARAEMWAAMREWFEGEVEVPNMPELVEDLKIVGRKQTSGALMIQSKDEIRRKHRRSPDLADALALTFALPFDLLPEREGRYQQAHRRRVLELELEDPLVWMTL